jgi:hypothetical protein
LASAVSRPRVHPVRPRQFSTQFSSSTSLIQWNSPRPASSRYARHERGQVPTHQRSGVQRRRRQRRLWTGQQASACRRRVRHHADQAMPLIRSPAMHGSVDEGPPG